MARCHRARGTPHQARHPPVVGLGQGQRLLDITLPGPRGAWTPSEVGHIFAVKKCNKLAPLYLRLSRKLGSYHRFTAQTCHLAFPKVGPWAGQAILAGVVVRAWGTASVEGGGGLSFDVFTLYPLIQSSSAPLLFHFAAILLYFHIEFHNHQHETSV